MINYNDDCSIYNYRRSNYINKPTYYVTGIRTDTKNTVTFPIHTHDPPILESYYYVRPPLDIGVFVIEINKA